MVGAKTEEFFDGGRESPLTPDGGEAASSPSLSAAPDPIQQERFLQQLATLEPGDQRPLHLNFDPAKPVLATFKLAETGDVFEVTPSAPAISDECLLAYYQPGLTLTEISGQTSLPIGTTLVVDTVELQLPIPVCSMAAEDAGQINRLNLNQPLLVTGVPEITRRESGTAWCGNWCGSSDPGAGLKDPSRSNHDGFLVLNLPDGRSVFAVADGAGGEGAADIASATALKSLAVDLCAGIEPLEAFAATELALRSLLELSAGDREQWEQLRLMTTTLLVVVATPASEGRYQLDFYHVGDSRGTAVRPTSDWRVRPEVLHQTRDQNLATHRLARGELEDQAARFSIDRARLYNAITVQREPDSPLKIEHSTIEAQSGDLLLLASDAVADVKRDVAVARILAQADSPESAIDRLRESIARGVNHLAKHFQATRAVAKAEQKPVTTIHPFQVDDHCTLVGVKLA